MSLGLRLGSLEIEKLGWWGVWLGLTGPWVMRHLRHALNLSGMRFAWLCGGFALLCVARTNVALLRLALSFKTRFYQSPGGYFQNDIGGRPQFRTQGRTTTAATGRLRWDIGASLPERGHEPARAYGCLDSPVWLLIPYIWNSEASRCFSRYQLDLLSLGPDAPNAIKARSA